AVDPTEGDTSVRSARVPVRVALRISGEDLGLTEPLHFRTTKPPPWGRVRTRRRGHKTLHDNDLCAHDACFWATIPMSGDQSTVSASEQVRRLRRRRADWSPKEGVMQQESEFEAVREYHVWGVENGRDRYCPFDTFEEAEEAR